MAVLTVYELFDILNAEGSADLSITAKDLDGNTQTIITSDNAKKWMLRKYPTRKYQVLKGQAVTATEAKTDFAEWYRLYLLNRAHNIDKMYQALFDYNYNPIENVDRYETETITGESETNYGRTETNSGTDRTAHTGTVTDAHTGTITDVHDEDGSRTNTGTVTDAHTGTIANAHTGTIADAHTGTIADEHTGSDTMVKSNDIVHETEKAGFNSPNAYTKSEKLTDSYQDYTEEMNRDTTDTRTHQDTETRTHNDTETQTNNNTDTRTDNTTETTTNDVTDTRTHANTDTRTDNTEDALTHGHVLTNGGRDTGETSSERELRVHGNIGVTTSSFLQREFVENTEVLVLADMILENFIDEATYYSV